jgi:transcriptional regulator with PAS, ATPase and Fis domain
VLAGYPWPGNIRELHNVIERLVLSGGTTAISGDDVMAVLPRPPLGIQAPQSSQSTLEEVERVHIQRVLEASGGNKTHAAKTLDIDYKTLLAKLKKYAL